MVANRSQGLSEQFRGLIDFVDLSEAYTFGGQCLRRQFIGVTSYIPYGLPS
jgi:hypothetical protein